MKLHRVVAILTLIIMAITSTLTAQNRRAQGCDKRPCRISRANSCSRGNGIGWGGYALFPSAPFGAGIGNAPITMPTAYAYPGPFFPMYGIYQPGFFMGCGI